MNVERRERIRALNDQLRQHHTGGRMMMTRRVAGAGLAFQLAVLGALQHYDRFDDDNDPHGEHDFGAISIDGEELFWKIDYYDQSLTQAAVDPACETGCVRVLVVMFAEEY